MFSFFLFLWILNYFFCFCAYSGKGGGDQPPIRSPSSGSRSRTCNVWGARSARECCVHEGDQRLKDNPGPHHGLFRNCLISKVSLKRMRGEGGKEKEERGILIFDYIIQPTAEIDRLLHFVVVGGGPSGVEYVSELNDFLLADLNKHFPQVLLYSPHYIITHFFICTLFRYI